MPVIVPVSSVHPEEFIVVSGPGIEVSDETTESAAAWASEQNLEVLDLVPSDLGALEALGLLQTVDPATYRRSPFAVGRTAGHALLVKPDVLQRAGLLGHHPADPVEILRLAVRVKRYACRTTDLAIAPQHAFKPTDPQKRKAVINESAGGFGGFIISLHAVILGLVASAPLIEPRWGTALLVTFQAQPLLALGGSSMKPKDLGLVTLFRLPIEAWRWLGTIRGRWRPEPPPDPVESRRDIYDELLKDGLQRFFEPARDACPLCNSGSLTRHLNVQDQLQNKPGTFHLDRCIECNHIFQNPRLSIEGLNFYYQDFYDGLWEDLTEQVFGFSDKPYHVRAGLLKGHLEPRRWLDVGGGHGHFCCAAKDVWPGAQFDCLELSESVDEAVRRRWVAHGYRGLFPEMAAEMADQYDVVSMSHYLEHAREPEMEIAAAATALSQGGYLLIEMPDPASAMGRLLGSFWVHWFQPQHQHLVSVENLNKLFGRHGFEALEWHRGEAHRPVDFMCAVVLLVARLTPDPNRPWRPRPTKFAVARHRSVWILALPVVLAAWGCDMLVAPIFRRPGLSNTYRVLARRTEAVQPCLVRDVKRAS